MKKDDIPKLQDICTREKVPVSVVGSITGKYLQLKLLEHVYELFYTN